MNEVLASVNVSVLMSRRAAVGAAVGMISLDDRLHHALTVLITRQLKCNTSCGHGTMQRQKGVQPSIAITLSQPVETRSQYDLAIRWLKLGQNSFLTQIWHQEPWL